MDAPCSPALVWPSVVVEEMKVTTIGLDLAKHVFQVHGVNASGEAVVRAPG